MQFPLESGEIGRPGRGGAAGKARHDGLAGGRAWWSGIIGALSARPRKAPPARRPGLLLAAMLAVTLGLAGCSAIKVAYNQAPELGYWYLDAYLDFTPEQRVQVKDDIGRLQAWHRQTQLPVYIDTLHRLKPQMAQDLSTAQACGVYEDVRRKLVAVSSQAEPALVTLVGQLQPAQLTHLQEKFAKGDAEWRDDFLDTSPKSARRERYKLALKRAEMLYGKLGEPQIAVLNRRLDDSVFDAKLSLAERQRRQQDVVQTLTPLIGGQAAPEKIAVALRGLQSRLLVSPDPAHRAYLEKLNQDACQTFADLHNSTTPEQRAKAAETLQKYADDFRLLNTRS